MKKLARALSPLNQRNDMRALLEYYFEKHLTCEMEIYDVGCGEKPFLKFMQGRVKNYIGVDIEDGFYDDSHIDIIGDAYNIPIKDGEADAVISSQVLEHLDQPYKAIKETFRILKPSGLFFLSVPFLYPIHAAPYDFTRFTSQYLSKTLDDHGFDIINYSFVGGFWYTISVNLQIYLNVINRGPIKKYSLLKILVWPFLWPLKIMHYLEGKIFQIAGKNPDKLRSTWTINHVLVARKRTT